MKNKYTLFYIFILINLFIYSFFFKEKETVFDCTKANINRCVYYSSTYFDSTLRAKSVFDISDVIAVRVEFYEKRKKSLQYYKIRIVTREKAFELPAKFYNRKEAEQEKDRFQNFINSDSQFYSLFPDQKMILQPFSKKPILEEY